MSPTPGGCGRGSGGGDEAYTCPRTPCARIRKFGHDRIKWCMQQMKINQINARKSQWTRKLNIRGNTCSGPPPHPPVPASPQQTHYSISIDFVLAQRSSVASLVCCAVEAQTARCTSGHSSAHWPRGSIGYWKLALSLFFPLDRGTACRLVLGAWCLVLRQAVSGKSKSQVRQTQVAPSAAPQLLLTDFHLFPLPPRPSVSHHSAASFSTLAIRFPLLFHLEFPEPAIQICPFCTEQSTAHQNPPFRPISNSIHAFSSRVPIRRASQRNRCPLRLPYLTFHSEGGKSDELACLWPRLIRCSAVASIQARPGFYVARHLIRCPVEHGEEGEKARRRKSITASPHPRIPLIDCTAIVL